MVWLHVIRRPETITITLAIVGIIAVRRDYPILPAQFGEAHEELLLTALTFSGCRTVGRMTSHALDNVRIRVYHHEGSWQIWRVQLTYARETYKSISETIRSMGGGGGLYMKNEKANYRDADLACSDSPLVDPHHLAYYRTSGCGCVSCSQSNQPETVAEIDHRAHTIDAPLTSHPISASPNGPDWDFCWLLLCSVECHSGEQINRKWVDWRWLLEWNRLPEHHCALTLFECCSWMRKTQSFGLCFCIIFICFLGMCLLASTLIQSIACRTYTFSTILLTWSPEDATRSFSFDERNKVSLNTYRLSDTSTGCTSILVNDSTSTWCDCGRASFVVVVVVVVSLYVPRFRRRFRIDNFRCLLRLSLHMGRCLECGFWPVVPLWFVIIVDGILAVVVVVVLLLLLLGLLLSSLASANSISGWWLKFTPVRYEYKLWLDNKLFHIGNTAIYLVQQIE